MLKVGTLIKHLSENNTEEIFKENPARLTFFNYLCHLCDPDENVTLELLESFFASAMDYAHWQQNRSSLGSEVRELLQEGLDLSNLRGPEETQMIELENQSDLTDALQFYLNALYKKGEKYRLIVEPDRKVVVIVLMPDQSLCIRFFDRKMIIRHGQLEPLKKDYSLFYTSDLELDPHHIQKIEIAPFVTAQFQAAPEGLQGCLVKGYLNQKFFDLNGPGLTAYPKLFYAIKRVERHFINRQTDPFYQETISALEKAIERVRLEDADSFQSSVEILARSQNAYEYVFAGDKLMSLLIRDLQHTLDQRNSALRPESSAVARTPQKVEQSWKQPLNQRIHAQSQVLYQKAQHSHHTQQTRTERTLRGTPPTTATPKTPPLNSRANPMENLHEEELTHDLTLDPSLRRPSRKYDLTN